MNSHDIKIVVKLAGLFGVSFAMAVTASAGNPSLAIIHMNIMF
jgi:hypothetical protein